MDWPSLSQRELVTIHSLSPEALGPAFQSWGIGSSNVASFSWPTANGAYYVPFSLSQPILASQLFVWNGATAAGHIDLGLYSEGGVRLVHSGSVSQVGTSVLQILDIADIALGPGRFYVAMSADSTSTLVRQIGLATRLPQMSGVASQLTAFPLPATATFASLALSGVFLPMIGLTGKALI